MNDSSPTLGRTALFDAHVACGARIVPFAGWEMPVQYAGVKGEAVAVRENCGLFDVGHMGQLDVRGVGVTEALNRIVSADWSKVKIGRAAYALLLTEDGAVQDDVLGYRLADDHWLVVVNAGRAASDEAHFRRFLPPEIELSNRYADQAMIAIQGPHAEAVLQPLCATDLSQVTWRDVLPVQVMGHDALLARGGYTGSDGFEWMGRAEDATALWNALLEGGASACGLGARDILRLEAALPLYGHELREDWRPDMSGCNWAVKTQKGDFVGRDALLQHYVKQPTTATVKGLKMVGRAVPREEYLVQVNGEDVGLVTSGSLSPTLEAGIALAVLPVEIEIGAEVGVVIRGTTHPAHVVSLPFVPHARRTPVATPVSKA